MDPDSNGLSDASPSDASRDANDKQPTYENPTQRHSSDVSSVIILCFSFVFAYYALGGASTSKNIAGARRGRRSSAIRACAAGARVIRRPLQSFLLYVLCMCMATTVESQCVTPTSTQGYKGNNKVETSLIINSFSVDGWTCDTDAGYTTNSAAVASACSVNDAPYTLSGCTLTSCTQPSCEGSSGGCIGYYWTEKSADRYTKSNFYLQSLQCNAGYKSSNGMGTYSCSSAGSAWSYSACNACSSGKFQLTRGEIFFVLVSLLPVSALP